jgi:hypothetical protein
MNKTADNIFLNKKILLIVFPFYEYHLKIENQLKNMGADVTVLLNQYNTTYAFSQNRSLFLMKKCLGMIGKSDLGQYKNYTYDFVLAIGGYSHTKNFLLDLKEKNH